jgi:threonine dehydrogenase-like Zn-dependent dehydrogenase
MTTFAERETAVRQHDQRCTVPVFAQGPIGLCAALGAKLIAAITERRVLRRLEA